MRSNTGQILYIPRVGQRANLQHPLMKGCVGWWPLTDGGGGIAKDIARANDGTGTGGASWASTAIGTAASFDGVNDRFSVSSFQGSSSGSVSFWAKTDLSGTINYAAFVSHGGDNAGVFEIANHQASTSLRWRLNFTGIADSGISKLSGTISTTDWAFYTLVWDSTNWSGYVDGLQLFFEAHGLTAASITKDLYFATRRTSQESGYMPGNIQNVRIYNRALSSSEVLELYTNPWSSLSMPSSTRYFFVPTQIQQIFPPRMKLKTSINVGKGGRIVI